MRIGLRMPPDHSILLSVIFRLYQFLVHLDRSPFKLQPSSSSRIGWESNLVANLTCKSLTEVRMTFSRHPSAEDGDTKLWLTRSTMDVSPGQRKSSASCRVPRFQLCFRLQRFPFLCFIRPFIFPSVRLFVQSIFVSFVCSFVHDSKLLCSPRRKKNSLRG